MRRLNCRNTTGTGCVRVVWTEKASYHYSEYPLMYSRAPAPSEMRMTVGVQSFRSRTLHLCCYHQFYRMSDCSAILRTAVIANLNLAITCVWLGFYTKKDYMKSHRCTIPPPSKTCFRQWHFNTHQRVSCGMRQTCYPKLQQCTLRFFCCNFPAGNVSYPDNLPFLLQHFQKQYCCT